MYFYHVGLAAVSGWVASGHRWDDLQPPMHTISFQCPAVTVHRGGKIDPKL
jgi:hypothetical protein